MKKLLLVFTLIILSFALFSCGEDEEVFDPVPSTAEESRIVLKFQAGDEIYEVKYELYRALFVGNHKLVDKGDASVWSGPEAAEKIEEINKIITDRAAEIYSVLHLAQKLGIDPYSSEADDRLYDHIKLYVHGGESSDGTKVLGYGSYEKYLNSLKEKGMNYAVGELMFRYAYALERINVELGGQIKVSDEELRQFYDGDDCARILVAYFQMGTKTEDRVKEIRDSINYAALAGNLAKVCTLIIQHTAAVSSEIIDSDGNPVGTPLGFYELDDYFYGEYISAAFTLTHGQVSRVITVDNVNDSYVDGYYIVIGLEKTEDYFNNNKSAIRASYVNNSIGQRLYTSKASLLESFSYTEVINQIDFSKLVK